MNSHKSVVFLLLLSSLFFAFDFTPYFLANEANVTVTYSNFSFENHSYSVVKFNSIDTFLMEDGAILTNESKINSILYSYYVSKYYPTDSELADLLASIDQFNKSRNDGRVWADGQEEYVCRDNVLLSTGQVDRGGTLGAIECVDDESCLENAQFLYASYGYMWGIGSVNDIYAPLKDFTLSSLEMDSLMSNYTYSLNNLNDATLISTLTYIKTTSTELEDLSWNIERSIFRSPNYSNSDDLEACEEYGCLFVCPKMDLNQDAANAIATKSAALYTKASTLTNFNSNNLYNKTMIRINYAESVELANEYSAVFATYNDDGNETITAAEDILTHVLNPTLSQKLAELKTLDSSISTSIDQMDFTTIESDIVTYSELVDEVANMTGTTTSQYNRTLTAKNNENMMILILETRDLDPLGVSSLEVLKTQTDDLNVQFRDGLSLDELAVLEGNYTALIDQAQELLDSESESPTQKAASMFRGLARRVNVALAAFADTTGIVSSSEISENPMFLGLFSLLTLLSFASIIILVFIYIFALNNFKVPKTSYIVLVGLASFLLVLSISAVFLFVFLDKTSSSATFTEFMVDFAPKQSVALTVDLRNTTFSDGESMQACANKFAETLSTQNKTWTIYSITTTTCTSLNSLGETSSLNTADCLEDKTDFDSSFIFGYSSVDSMDLSIIYENKAEINADKNYYDSCPLTIMFG